VVLFIQFAERIDRRPHTVALWNIADPKSSLRL